MLESKLPKSKRDLMNFSRSYLFRIFKKQGILCCHYCGKSDLKIEWNINKRVPNMEKATIDHIIPISKGGGKFDNDNLVVCCSICNNKKGDLDYEEFKKQLLDE